jgi:hypothetical protein
LPSGLMVLGDFVDNSVENCCANIATSHPMPLTNTVTIFLPLPVASPG